MRRDEMKLNRKIGGIAFVCGLIALGLIPWQTYVKAPGWIHAAEQHVVYTPTPGKLETMRGAGPVKKGERLFTLTSPDIALNALRSQALAKASALELRGLSGLEDGEARRKQLQLQQEKFSAEVKLYQDELDRMDLTAPFDGELLDLDDNLSQHTWIHTEQPLAILIDPNSWVADAFIPEDEIKRVNLGDKAELYVLGNDFHIIEGVVSAIDTAKINKLPHHLLDAIHGGEIATLPNGEGVPTQAFYKVRLRFDNMHIEQMRRIQMTNVSIKTQPEAWLPRIIKRIAAVLIRESGF